MKVAIRMAAKRRGIWKQQVDSVAHVHLSRHQTLSWIKYLYALIVRQCSNCRVAWADALNVAQLLAGVDRVTSSLVFSKYFSATYKTDVPCKLLNKPVQMSIKLMTSTFNRLSTDSNFSTTDRRENSFFYRIWYIRSDSEVLILSKISASEVYLLDWISIFSHNSPVNLKFPARMYWILNEPEDLTELTVSRTFGFRPSYTQPWCDFR